MHWVSARVCVRRASTASTLPEMSGGVRDLGPHATLGRHTGSPGPRCRVTVRKRPELMQPVLTRPVLMNPATSHVLMRELFGTLLEAFGEHMCRTHGRSWEAAWNQHAPRGARCGARTPTYAACRCSCRSASFVCCCRAHCTRSGSCRQAMRCRRSPRPSTSRCTRWGFLFKLS